MVAPSKIKINKIYKLYVKVCQDIQIAYTSK